MSEFRCTCSRTTLPCPTPDECDRWAVPVTASVPPEDGGTTGQALPVCNESWTGAWDDHCIHPHGHDGSHMAAGGHAWLDSRATPPAPVPEQREQVARWLRIFHDGDDEWADLPESLRNGYRAKADELLSLLRDDGLRTRVEAAIAELQAEADDRTGDSLISVAERSGLLKSVARLRRALDGQP